MKSVNALFIIAISIATVGCGNNWHGVTASDQKPKNPGITTFDVDIDMIVRNEVDLLPKFKSVNIAFSDFEESAFDRCHLIYEVSSSNRVLAVNTRLKTTRVSKGIFSNSKVRTAVEFVNMGFGVALLPEDFESIDSVDNWLGRAFGVNLVDVIKSKIRSSFNIAVPDEIDTFDRANSFLLEKFSVPLDELVPDHFIVFHLDASSVNHSDIRSITCLSGEDQSHESAMDFLAQFGDIAPER